MIKTKNDLKIKVNQTYINNTNPLSLITFISVAFIGFEIHTVFVEQTDTINKTKIVQAPKNKLWNIVSDMYRNSNY